MVSFTFILKWLTFCIQCITHALFTWFWFMRCFQSLNLVKNLCTKRRLISFQRWHVLPQCQWTNCKLFTMPVWWNNCMQHISCASTKFMYRCNCLKTHGRPYSLQVYNVCSFCSECIFFLSVKRDSNGECRLKMKSFNVICWFHLN